LATNEQTTKKIQGEIEEVGYFSILRNFQLSGSKSKNTFIGDL
jgi:hypothetical protein